MISFREVTCATAGLALRCGAIETININRDVDANVGLLMGFVRYREKLLLDDGSAIITIQTMKLPKYSAKFIVKHSY